MNEIVWPVMAIAGDHIVDEFRPFCDRVEVAGSILRRKQYPGDVEIVCIPKPGISEASTEQMFAVNAKKTEDVPDQLTKYLAAEVADEGRHPVWWKRKKTTGAVAGFGPKNKLVFRRWTWDVATTIPIPPTVKVDVFSATAETWGAIMAIRTGPSELNQFIAVRAKKLGIKLTVRDGGFFMGDGTLIQCATEEKFFETIQIPFVPAPERTAEFISELQEQDHDHGDTQLCRCRIVG